MITITVLTEITNFNNRNITLHSKYFSRDQGERWSVWFGFGCLFQLDVTGGVIAHQVTQAKSHSGIIDVARSFCCVPGSAVDLCWFLHSSGCAWFFCCWNSYGLAAWDSWGDVLPNWTLCPNTLLGDPWHHDRRQPVQHLRIFSFDLLQGDSFVHITIDRPPSVDWNQLSIEERNMSSRLSSSILASWSPWLALLLSNGYLLTHLKRQQSSLYLFARSMLFIFIPSILILFDWVVSSIFPSLITVTSSVGESCVSYLNHLIIHIHTNNWVK